MFQKYIYDDWKGPTKDSKNPRENPKDINKDYPDCVRYWIMSNPTYLGNEASIPSTFSSRTGYH